VNPPLQVVHLSVHWLTLLQLLIVIFAWQVTLPSQLVKPELQVKGQVLLLQFIGGEYVPDPSPGFEGWSVSVTQFNVLLKDQEVPSAPLQ